MTEFLCWPVKMLCLCKCLTLKVNDKLMCCCTSQASAYSSFAWPKEPSWMHYCVKTATLIGPTEENCLYSAHCHYCTHACLHNKGFIAYQVQCENNDARELWTALTYLQMVGHIRWIKGVLGDVSDMTTQRSMCRWAEGRCKSWLTSHNQSAILLQKPVLHTADI